MSLRIAVQFASTAAYLPSRAQVRRWVQAAHTHSQSVWSGALVTIRYVDNAEGRALNRDFRGMDYATNVLTFAHEAAVAEYAADIVICAPVIAREAREQKKSAHSHHAHMVVHGMLHAQGMDHEVARAADAMEAIEIAILRRFRIKNPYVADEP